MPFDYRLRDSSSVYSPALLFYPGLIKSNLRHMIEIAGSVSRLRPHAKTHKCAEITKMELALGITKHKCATLREAQMLAQCGVPDVLIAYPIVGPNIFGIVKLLNTFPRTRFSLLVDDFGALQNLSTVLQKEKQTLDVLVDVNVGQHRTGASAGSAVLGLLDAMAKYPESIRLAGIHVYDGQNNAPPLLDREKVTHEVQDQIRIMCNEVRSRHVTLPRIVVSGTPAFQLHAKYDLPELELSPGTCVLHDWNYSRDYPELGFTPAAVVLTRCVSRPTPNRVTFDLGTKAVCSDPPAGKRCLVLGLEEAVAVAHNEEHLVLETSEAAKWNPGDVAYAIPAHICPTVALHRWAHIVEQGKVVDKWEITARDRELTL